MSDQKTLDEEGSVPFFPDHVRTELLVVVGILIVAGVIGGWALLSPVGLEAPANPMDTPAHVKPEWYFLSLYQLLKFVPKTAGAVLPVLAVLVLALWPFIDRKPGNSRKARLWRIWAVGIGLVLLIAMTIWGEVS